MQTIPSTDIVDQPIPERRAPSTFAEEVRQRLENAPAARRIVIARRSFLGRIEYRTHDYGELCQASQSVAAGLRRRGVVPGTRTLVLVKPGFDFFTVLLALLDAGAVPVLIDPGIGTRQMMRCIRDARVEAMIAEPRAFLLRLLRPAHFSFLKAAVSTGSIRVPGAIPLGELRIAAEPAQPARRAPDDVAMIGYTSGSTGPSKGVAMTYENLAAAAEMFRALGGDDDGMDLIALPPLALVSILQARSLVMPDLDYRRLASARPEDLVDAIRTHRVTTCFGSPIVYRNLARHCVEHGIQLESVKRAFCAGAPVPLDTLRQFSKILPPASDLVTPYGATEAMPLCAIGAREILRETAHATESGAGVCIGRPLDGTHVKVIRLTDGVIEQWDPSLELAPGRIGELVVQGPQVTAHYLDDPRATRRAKIVETRPDGTEVIWHRMGDLGRFDPAGRVWFCGRTQHVVRKRGKSFYPVCVEGLFNSEPDIHRTALVGYDTKRGHELALVVEPESRPSRSAWRHRAEELRAIARRHGIPLTRVILHPRPLPTDRRHNSKIDRLALARWAARR
jgi:acyl-CoA synthetase (AMP-forming)/AMP-acid ligase II